MRETINKITFTPAEDTGCFVGLCFGSEAEVITYYFQVNMKRMQDVRQVVIKNELLYGIFRIEEESVYYSFGKNVELEELQNKNFVEVEPVPYINVMPEWESETCFMKVSENAWSIEFDFESENGTDVSIYSGHTRFEK